MDLVHQMREGVTSRIMTRTTVDIDASVLLELKRRQKESGKSLGVLMSELLAGALQPREPAGPAEFTWTSRSMGVLIDLEDKEAVRRATEGR
jgi:hypothetical protein